MEPKILSLKTAMQTEHVILSPRRALRPNISQGLDITCPFCRQDDQDVLRVADPQNMELWLVRVIINKYPFAPIHEIILHSSDHHKDINELPSSHIAALLDVFRQRFTVYRDQGSVCIFHNSGIQAGESIPHPHSQLVVIPSDIPLQTPVLTDVPTNVFHTNLFSLFSPLVSQWPDEVWIVPTRRYTYFGDIRNDEIAELAGHLSTVITLLDLRHGLEFPFNYTIHPGKDWFIRIIPRQKVIGGFEVGTGIYVNTQDPQETNAFLREHLLNPQPEKIIREQQAKYHKTV